VPISLISINQVSRSAYVLTSGLFMEVGDAFSTGGASGYQWVPAAALRWRSGRAAERRRARPDCVRLYLDAAGTADAALDCDPDEACDP
jgi:hypothetical protein